MYTLVASSPGHSQFFNVTCIEKLGVAWGRGYTLVFYLSAYICHEMVLTTSIVIHHNLWLTGTDQEIL